MRRVEIEEGGNDVIKINKKVSKLCIEGKD